MERTAESLTHGQKTSKKAHGRMISAPTTEGISIKKYLGTWINAYCALVCIVLVFLSLTFAVLVLSAEISTSTVIIALWCLAFTCIIAYVAYKNRYGLFAVGHFQNDGLLVKCLFSKDKFIPYCQFNYISMGMYIHRVLSTSLGSKLYYIILSCDGFDENLKLNINHWRASEKHIKVGHNKKLFNYLIAVLPKKHSLKLLEDKAALLAEK